MIVPTRHVISIARQCELIQLPRASYYRAVDYGPVAGTEGAVCIDFLYELFGSFWVVFFKK